MTGRWGSSPKCWKTIENFFRRSSRRRAGLAARMSSPSRSTLPSVGSIRRVRQRTSVDLPLPDRPMTTKTSPGFTSNDTSRTATVPPWAATAASMASASGGLPAPLATFASAGPKTFHRSRTVSPPAVPSGIGSVMVALTLRSIAVAARASAAEPACGTRCRVLPDVLGLTVLVQTAGAKFPPEARLLEAAPLGLRTHRCCSR